MKKLVTFFIIFFKTYNEHQSEKVHILFFQLLSCQKAMKLMKFLTGDISFSQMKDF